MECTFIELSWSAKTNPRLTESSFHERWMFCKSEISLNLFILNEIALIEWSFGLGVLIAVLTNAFK